MKTYSLDMNPPGLPALIDEVKHGVEIAISEHGHEVARIVPAPGAPPSVQVRRPRVKTGCLKGFWMAPDFDAPLDDFREYMG